MGRVKIMLVDDHPLFREGLRMLLEAQGDFEVVGEASNGRDAVLEARKRRPDIIVMDITMEGNGLEATRQVLLALPETRVLILTMHASEEYFFKALEAGAAGYVVKGTTSAELVAALRAVAKGEVFLHPAVAGYLVTDYLGQVRKGEEQETYNRLSEREQQVLALIAQGYTNAEIAEHLHISVYTVQTHRTHIMEKLNLHNRGDLLKYAVRLGFLKPS
ncbi:MAG: response regulator transcription factor [Chloroflexi bacterium]|nr:response regulator transcription factor [Chloroflexota bacterium]